MKIQDILKELNRLAPQANQSSWDNSGVQVSGTVQEAAKVAVTLEPTPEAVNRCLEWGADLVLTHHPLSLEPKFPVGDTPYLAVLRAVMGAGAWLYAAHTSLDVRSGGPAFWLGRELGLRGCKLLDVEKGIAPLEVFFPAPRPVKREEAEIWADRDGVLAVSQTGNGEVRIICEPETWPGLNEAICFSLGRDLAFYVRPMTGPCRDVGFGEVGDLDEPLAWSDFTARLDALGPLSHWTACGSAPETVARVAYCGGSGSSLMRAAADAGADVLITGDVKYHAAVEAPLCTLDMGHFSLEEEMMRRFAGELAEVLKGVDIKFFKGVDPFRFHMAP